MSTERKRRCTDCGAEVETTAEFCPDCWSDSLVWVEGAELSDLKQWEAYIQERRLHYNGGFGDEPTVICDRCGKRIEATDAGNSLYNGKPICGACKQVELQQ